MSNVPTVDAQSLTKWYGAIPFLVAALIACYLPTRRATSVDPNVALRQP